MSERGRSGINRPFSWLKRALQITEKTVAPDALRPDVVPTIDVFGWERLAGLGPSSIETVTGALATDVVNLTPVPQGIARYVIYASCSTDDPAGLILSLQVGSGGVAFGITDQVFVLVAPLPIRLGLQRNILLQPGENLLCRSLAAPAAGQRLFIRYKFVDLEPGEYLPAL